jgi:hypothetical protein
MESCKCNANWLTSKNIQHDAFAITRALGDATFFYGDWIPGTFMDSDGNWTSGGRWTGFEGYGEVVRHHPRCIAEMRSWRRSGW